MDGLLGELGVVTSHEAAITSLILEQNQSVNSSSEYKTVSDGGNYALAAKSIIETDLNPLEASETNLETDLSYFARGNENKKRAARAQLDRIRKREQGKTTHLSVRTHSSGVQEIQNDALNEPSSDIVCPVCNKALQPVGNKDAFINSHIDRCMRRRSTVPSSSYQMLTSNDEVGQDDLLVDSDEDVNRSSSKKRAVKKKLHRKNDKNKRISFDQNSQRNDGSDEGDNLMDTRSYTDLEDEYVDEEALDDINDDDMGDGSNQKSSFDDWEEEDFIRRTSQLSQEQTEIHETSFGTQVSRQAWDSLYQYQQEGCKWLYSLYQEGVGGILADEMGKLFYRQVLCTLNTTSILNCRGVIYCL